MSFILAIFMQVGPAPTEPVSRSVEPPELSELRERLRTQKRDERGGFSTALITECRAEAMANSVAAETDAQSWLSVAEGDERAAAYHCLGLAMANQGRWEEAADALQNALGLAPQKRPQYRAQLAGLAGNAQLAQGLPQRALDLLDAALAADIPPALRAEIATDRARALVSLERLPEAAEALVTAREAAPDNGFVWLLSATLSRRNEDLATAQAQIERAADLDTADLAIPLEAGLIAAMSGRDEAARASWQSIIALAPDSVYAEAAMGYLAQLETP